MHEFSGTREKTYELLELAGFGKIIINVVERGRWMQADSLKGTLSSGAFAIGQYPDPLENIPEETLPKANQDYWAEVDRQTTEQGVWHDMTTFYVCAQKI